MQHRVSRTQIINHTLIAYSDLLNMIKAGRIMEAQEYILDAYQALMQVVQMDKEDEQCQETLMRKLVSEGTILLMPRGGIGSSVRRPQTQPTEPQPS